MSETSYPELRNEGVSGDLIGRRQTPASVTQQLYTDFQRTLSEIARSVNARHASLVMRHVPGVIGENPLVIETMGSTWRNHYHLEKFESVDPGRLVADFAMEPIDWSDLPRTRPKIRRFLRQFSDHGGGRNALSSPFRGPYGDRSVLTFSSDATDRQWNAMKMDLIAVINREHPGLHRRALRQFFDISVMPSVRLTPRERECLGLAAHGHTSKQIGENLGLTTATVNFFIDAASEKLSASNRAHAAAKAVAMGLISPPR